MRLRQLTVAVIATSLVLPSGCAAKQANSAGQPTPACTQHSVAVNLSDTDPVAYNVAGWLCPGRGDKARAGVVQLLVSGLTFDHNYWDTAYEPGTYSYVNTANDSGYATFNIDRIGVGRSGRPPADKLTLQAHAHTIAQIVAKLRTGDIGGTPFNKVVGVGHSLGAGILQYEAGVGNDPSEVPDYLILFGYLSKTDPTVVARIGTDLYPAGQDPRFLFAGLPADYLTTKPGTRGDLFLSTDSTPGIVAFDEAVKQTSSLAERTTVAAARDPKITNAISIPVLLAVGQQDRLACAEAIGLSCASGDAVVAREAANFSPRACLSAYVLAGAGHALNLDRNAQQAFTFGNSWLDRQSGEQAARDSYGCLEVFARERLERMPARHQL